MQEELVSAPSNGGFLFCIDNKNHLLYTAGMKKLLFGLTILAIVIGATIMATLPTHSPTKIPYNNGFYAGAYNPKLPVIDPTAK